jgi:polysaccharide export outer membrane protein
MKRFLQIHKLGFVLIGIALLLGSCVNLSKVRLLQQKPGESMNFENSKKTTYHVNTGDHLYIRIYSVDPKTSKFFQTDFPSLMNPTYVFLNSYVVDEQGYISFSFIDKVFVRGLSVDEVRALLQKTISDYFKEATVMVRLVNFQIAVLGEVGSPGNFTIDQDQITILQALGKAGGMNTFANVRKVKLVRQTLKGSEIIMLDLTKSDILSSDYFYLMPNDVLYVEPRTAKSFAFDKFPYGWFLSLPALAFSIIAVATK